MCRRVDCRKCGKPSFAGCGQHVDQVLAGVPPDRRCRCADKRSVEGPKSGPKPWWQVW